MGDGESGGVGDLLRGWVWVSVAGSVRGAFVLAVAGTARSVPLRKGWNALSLVTPPACAKSESGGRVGSQE